MDAKNSKLTVSINEAALMLGVSPRTIHNYIRTKQLSARKLGRRTVVPLRALELFAASDHPSARASEQPDEEKR
jgi:excisionase family DNA binding protein